MKAFQYSRLSSSEPETKKYRFSALDGPSYFTYGVPAGKYSSAFTYSRQPMTDGLSAADDRVWADMHHGSEELYSTSNMSRPPSQSFAFKLLTVIVSCLCYLLFVMTLPVSAIFVLKSAQPYERFVVFRLGRLLATRGPVNLLPKKLSKLPLQFRKVMSFLPAASKSIKIFDGRSYTDVYGIQQLMSTETEFERLINDDEFERKFYCFCGYAIIFPCIDQWIKVDLRTKAFSVPPLKAITADGATIEIGADVYFRVKDPVLSVSNVQDLNHATRILCQTLLQKNIGRQNLCEVESDRVNITDALLKDVNVMSQTWGVEVGKIELSALKIHSQPNPLFNQATNDVLSCLSSVLFPPGVNNAPVEQLQQFYRMAVGHPQKLPISGDNIIGAGESGEASAANPMINLVTLIQPHLGPSLVSEFGCTYKFVVANEAGTFDVYHLDLKNGEGRAGLGVLPDGAEADVTLHLSSALLVDLLAQRVRPFDAYMDGRLTVAGDLRAAMRLGELIKLVTTGTIPVIHQ